MEIQQERFRGVVCAQAAVVQLRQHLLPAGPPLQDRYTRGNESQDCDDCELYPVMQHLVNSRGLQK